MTTTGIQNKWSITHEQCGDKQAYSQNIFKIWNNFLSISRFGHCEVVKMKPIKQIYLIYCSMDVLLKDKMAFCNSLEIYFSAYRLLWVNKKSPLAVQKGFFCRVLFRQFIEFMVKLLLWSVCLIWMIMF